jgi:type I restriction enzyme S subunit
VEQGILNFRVSNIGRSVENFGEVQYLPLRFWQAFPKQRLLGGEIVIVMVGSPPGSLGRVPSEMCPALQNQNMWNLIPISGVDQDFLWFLLPGAVARHMSQSQGSARDFLTQKDFRRTRAVKPSSEEQKSIAKRLSVHEGRLAVERAELAKLCALKRGLMDDLLTGRVRVTANEDTA